jgi:acyl-CoA reductase-like NAD-dependent aldehyde dehydrogenase
MAAPLLIGSDWVTTDRTARIVSPYDGSTVGEVCLAGPEQLRRAIMAAHEAFERTARRQPAFERSALLARLAAAIERERAEFVRLIIAEAGKPRTLAEAEVTRAVSTFTLAAEAARETRGALLDMDAFAAGKGHTGIVRRFPIGVIYGITPFNFPLNLVAHKVAPALAAGNTIIIKPSPQTPHTALKLGRLAQEAGAMPGQLNVVCCSNEDAVVPLSDDRVKLVSFTGSAEVGWKIKAQSGKRRVALELGGNAAAIVHEDAALDAAIPLLATGSFSYAGQSCISTQRIFVHASIYDTFRARFVAEVRGRIITGDPNDPKVTVGPMINPAALVRVRAWIAAATSTGATVLHGGHVKGNCLEATILEVPHQDFELCREEAFAPIVTLQRYETFDEALSLVNASRYGLQAGVFTQDIGRILQAFDTLEVGGVLINQVPTFRVDNQPYGGVKDSGLGREGVRAAMEEMSELKSLIIRVE